MKSINEKMKSINQVINSLRSMEKLFKKRGHDLAIVCAKLANDLEDPSVEGHEIGINTIIAQMAFGFTADQIAGLSVGHFDGVSTENQRINKEIKKLEEEIK